MSASKHQCDNCRRIFRESALREVKHLSQRVDANGPMPSGECPSCGALCYPLMSPPDDLHLSLLQSPHDMLDAVVASVRCVCKAKQLTLKDDGEQVLVETLNDAVPLGGTSAAGVAYARFFAAHPRMMLHSPDAETKDDLLSSVDVRGFMRATLYAYLYRRARAVLRV